MRETQLMSDTAKKYLSRLRTLILNGLKGENVKVMLFGSRAKGTNRPFSDVDIGILPIV